MISTDRYFIHIDNGSVVPWTSEIEGNYKFKEITFKVAMAIEMGRISAKEVLAQITKQIKPSSLDEMLDAKLKMNVREGELNLEAQIKDDNTQKDTGSAKPFGVELPGEGSSRRSRRAEKVEDEPGGDESEPVGVNV